MKSLIVVSLPCSLSTFVYHASRLLLGLSEPSGVSDGEFLNGDRWRELPQELSGWSNDWKFALETNHLVFDKLMAFACSSFIPEGCIYKDVVNPWVVSQLINNKNVSFLRIKRPIADVAYAMLQRNWLYPSNVISDKHERLHDLVHGLIDAEQTLDALGGALLSFDELINDESCIEGVLKRLYPSYTFKKIRYIDDEFRRVSESILQRRKSDVYHELDAIAKGFFSNQPRRDAFTEN